MAFIKEEGVINSVTLVFLVSQAVTRPNVKSRNLWCLFAKSSWNVNVLKILCICCCAVSRKYIAFLRFWSTWFEVSIVYWQKKQLRHSWNVSTLPLSLEQWARSCLFWIFTSPFATLVDRAVIFRVFLFFLRPEKWIVVLFYWVKRVQRQNTCKRSKGRVNVQGLRHW